MDDLVRWLDEDTARATEAGEELGPDWHYDDGYVLARREGDMVATGSQDFLEVERGRFIAEWDPARVLREIDAKREQIGWCTEVIGDRDLSRYEETGSLKDDPDALAVMLAVETLRLLALPYADRPGYRAEWAPTE